MANDIIVSEMTSASQINTNDLMIMTQPDLLAETGYSTKKGTVLQVANKMLKGTEYLTDLPDFTDKTVLGGLEELKGDLTALLPVDTASGAIANFDTDLSLPLVDCKANIVATGGNGTPDNPNPINGYTEANITRCGVNLWGHNDVTISYATYVINNEDIYLPAGTYTFQFKFSGTTGNKSCRVDDADGNQILSFGAGVSVGLNSNSFTIPEGKVGVKFKFYSTAIGTYSDMMFSIGSSVPDFKAYTGNAYAIALGDTYYGGVLDVTRGVLTITHANIASYNGESINEPWLSSMDVYTPGGTPTTGAQVVYPLTTPFDIDLTPEVISAIVGTNNVYSDTNGDTEVKYKEGIQHYIDKKIAATQALIL